MNHYGMKVQSGKAFFFFFLVENTLENQDELIYNDELKLQK